MTRWWTGLDPGSLLAILALATYLTTAGGHAYSTDGTFAYEMAKSAVLDPEHQYWGRFRSAFARWGVGMPAFAQPFVLGGAALGTLAPERDDIVVDGRRLRVETWPEVRAGQVSAFPLPGAVARGDLVRSITVVSSLANAPTVADRSTVAELQLTGPSGTTSVPIRAGVETSEWAWDRPDVRGTVAHRRADVAGHWVGQPRGNLYVARLRVDPPQQVSAWGARGSEALGASGTWEVRAASFEVEDRPDASAGGGGAPADRETSTWHDARTGDRIWSERQSRDFWAQLGFAMANAVATALSVLMVWRVGGHLGFREPVRLVTAAGYAFGTIAWPYAKFDFSEPLAALAILVAADATYRAFPNRKSPALSRGEAGQPPPIPTPPSSPKPPPFSDSPLRRESGDAALEPTPPAPQGEERAMRHGAHGDGSRARNEPCDTAPKDGSRARNEPCDTAPKDGSRARNEPCDTAPKDGRSMEGAGGGNHERTERGVSKYRDWHTVAVVVVACLVAIATKYAAAFAVAALAIEGIAVARPWASPPAQRRRILAFGSAVAAPFAVGGAIALAMLLRTTGEVPILLTSGLDRLRDDWFTLPLWTGLRGLLTSSGKGLFVHAPWLLLAPAGMAMHVARVRHHGAAGLVMLVAYPALTVVAYAQKLVWHGGAWGPRYLVLALPWITLACSPVIEWALARRARRAALATLGVISVAVQLLAIAKHPEQFTAIARRHVLAALPRFGADLGGRDYWDARGGELLGRALRDEASGTARARSLGYLWGFPDASATIRFREAREIQLGLYAVDWDRRSRTQAVTIEDAVGTRTIDLGPEMAAGAWVLTTVRGAPGQPVTIRLRQTGPDTAVLSAITFDAPLPAGPSGRDPQAVRLDRETAGDWPGRYGADGRIFPAFRSFNIDEVRLPPYVEGYDLDHVGDRPNPTIHVEIAEDDLLDTAILYAAPFAPLLGNAWLVAADLLHLLAPGRPDLADGVLMRPPWRWFGIDAPRLDHPEYGLGLDFWPTLIWTNYASHRGVIAVAAVALVAMEGVALVALARLLDVAGTTPRVGARSVIALAMAFVAYDALMVLP